MAGGPTNEGGKHALRELTRDWFLFLATFRRQVRSMPADVEWVRSRLEDMLKSMERRAASDPRLEARLRDARPPLVYLADEILLDCGWDGEAAWERDLLETRVFGTQHAGQDFFDRLDRAMNQDDVELLEIYHKAICMGFRGRLVKQPAVLGEIRRNLFRRLKTQPVEGARFCPEAYESIDDRDFVKLPAVATARILIALVAVLVAIYTVASMQFHEKFRGLREAADHYVDPTTPTPGEG
ncbi:MAG: DotU family type IV/VI secretion system protein [Planctomycetes bacterium]|nr:DotU family type IV/VI secretion system protein [Planctomycetota bacterium]